MLPDETQMIEMKRTEMLFQEFVIPQKQCQGKQGVRLNVHKKIMISLVNGHEIDVGPLLDEFNCSSC